MAPVNRDQRERHVRGRRVVALAAGVALVLGSMGCSGDDGDGDVSQSPGSGETTTSAGGMTTLAGTTTVATAPGVTTVPAGVSTAPVADSTAPATAAGSATTAAGPVIGEYIVQPGDNLGAIATRVGVSVAEIAQFNGITNINQIQAGQILRIPAPGTVVVTTAAPVTAVPVTTVAPGGATLPPPPTVAG